MNTYTATDSLVTREGSPLVRDAYRAARDGGLAVVVNRDHDGVIRMVAADATNGGQFVLTMTPGLTRPSHAAVYISRQGATFRVAVSEVRRKIQAMIASMEQRAATAELTVQEDTMTEAATPAQDVTRLSPAAYDMKAARRWIDEQYEGAASCADWTTLQVLEFIAEHHVQGLKAFRRYRFYTTYVLATAEVQLGLDTVFETVEDAATPHVGVSRGSDGSAGAGFSLPTGDPDDSDDPTHYVVDIDPLGRLARLRRWVQTGRWFDNGEGELEPDGSWVTVSRFSQDPAGKLFKRSRAAAYALQTAAWMEAVTR